MKWITALVTALLLVSISTTEVKAQSITIRFVNLDNAGQLLVNTQVTLPDGWKVSSVELQARPAGGVKGPGGVETAAVKDQAKGIYEGTITGLTSKKTYDVQATLFVTDPGNKKHTYFSTSVDDQTVK